MSAALVIGEAPARIRTGQISATVKACRAYRPANRETDLRKQAAELRLTADGFDRQATFADDEGKPSVAARARAESARLRAVADGMAADAAIGKRNLCVN